MPKEVNPKDTDRAAAYKLWMKAPNPMVTFFKTFDVTNIIKVSKKRKLKFNMLLDYCIGKAAAAVKEFYMLPVSDKLIWYNSIAVNTIVKNKNGAVSSCDLSFDADLNQFNEQYSPQAVWTGTYPRKAWSSAHLPLSTRKSMEPSA